MATPSSYSRLQVALHWLVAALVLATWPTGGGMGRALHQKLEGIYPGFQPHVWLGIAVFATVMLRLAVRCAEGVPDAPAGSSDPEARARHYGHLLLYGLLVAIPLAGVATWFFGATGVAEAHALAGNALIWLAGGHALIALWHHYVRRDGTLARMLRPA